MSDYYKEQDSIVEEKGFYLELLNDFQQKLLAHRKKRIIAQTELYRKRQTWLVEATKGRDVRLHMQPREDRINELMDNLDRFIQKSNLHPLITAAVAYGQLVMIHPWRYCNGRVTGALIPYIFNSLDISRERTFYLSAVFAKDKGEYYYQLVELFRENDWNGWISYFLQKVKERLERLNQSKTTSILESIKVCQRYLKTQYLQ